MGSEKIHKGSCFCGGVQFEVSGEPAGMGYCHCESCRQWSAGPVNDMPKEMGGSGANLPE